MEMPMKREPSARTRIAGGSTGSKEFSVDAPSSAPQRKLRVGIRWETVRVSLGAGVFG